MMNAKLGLQKFWRCQENWLVDKNPKRFPTTQIWVCSCFSCLEIILTLGRAKIFGDSWAYDFPKIWAQNQTGVAISGHSEKISPGVIRSEVGRPEGLWLTTGRPTSECITPGEILSEWPEITTPVWFWPKFLENHTPVNPQKFSRGLLWGYSQRHWAFQKTKTSDAILIKCVPFEWQFHL